MLKKRVLILDGGMGTEIFERVDTAFEFPEIFNITRRDIICDIHKCYIEAGADIIETNTLGANRIKLGEYGEGKRVREINLAAAEIANKAREGKPVLIAGSIGPLGRLIEPLGQLSVEQAYVTFAEQAKALEQGGVDFFLIETQIDILEAKTALRACKDTTSSLPVGISMVFPLENGRTITGSDPATFAVTFSIPDLDLFGINCEDRPEKLVPFLSEITAHSQKPLIVYPNAGKPVKTKGKTSFSLGPKEFLPYAMKCYEEGANIIGGCCGTTPDHIRLIAQKLKGRKPAKREARRPCFKASSRNSVLLIGGTNPFRRIGENINPFAKKELRLEFKENRISLARTYAKEQEKAGADALDINMGKKGENDPAFYAESIKDLQSVSTLPFLLDNANPDSLENALKLYAGKGVINSVSGEKKSYERLFPLARKYGAGVILLALDEKGIPDKAKERIKIIENLYEEALDSGLSSDDILADPITLALSSSQQATSETLKAIKMAHSRNIPTTIGLSNVSFGLPQRKWINSSFLTMAIVQGLNSAILNPLDQTLTSLIHASEALTGKDRGMSLYIKRFSHVAERPLEMKKEDFITTPEKKLFQALLEGDKTPIKELIDTLLRKGKDGFEILEEILTPALKKAGEYYENKIYFLPQLILSAEAMQASSQILERAFPRKKPFGTKEKIILATVKGDLHDIGKNIVGLVLRNFGYDVIDLGKNVDSERIVDTAVKEKAGFIGLSSLMTTTLDEMEHIIALRNARASEIKIILGGAAVSLSFANQIGADAYGKDALDAVRKIKALAGATD